MCFSYRNEDFTTTMYQNHYEKKSLSKDEEKVDKMCAKLRQVFGEFIIFFV